MHNKYMGPKNPKTKGEKDSYVVPPTDYQDYAAFKHDKGYGNLNVSGFKGTQDIKTNDVDLKFLQDLIRYLPKTRSIKSYLGMYVSSNFFTIMLLYKNAKVLVD